MGDYGLEAPWNDNAIKGVSRFLDKVYNLKDKVVEGNNYSTSLEVIINKTIKKVSEDYEQMKFNTAISEMMKLTNTYMEKDSISKEDYLVLLKLLYPVAPHVTEELNELIGNNKMIVDMDFPEYDLKKVIDDTITIGVQINGKLRDTITIKTTDGEEEILNIAKNSDNVKKNLEGKTIIKEIVVPGRIVNIVVK